MSRPKTSSSEPTSTALPQLWWESLENDVEDPITLEPINTLSYPPFVLRKSSSETTSGGGHNEKEEVRCYYFDGLALASYIVSRGIFQNPLTRESLTWDDCRRLDQYLDAYDDAYWQTGGNVRETMTEDSCHRDIHAGRNTQRRFRVLEAFALRESVQVRNRNLPAASEGRNQQIMEEAQRQRADVLRSEAAAALSGLFVYGTNHHSSDSPAPGNRRGRHSRHHHHHHNQQQQSMSPASNPARFSQGQPLEPNPTFGFNLHVRDTHNIINNNNNDDEDGYGMVVIDDDDQVRVESEDHAYQQLQEAFPRLTASSTNELHTNPESSSLSNGRNEEEMQRSLERIQQQALRDRQQEWVRQQALQYARQQLEEEARQRKRELHQKRQAIQEKAKATYEQQRNEQEELQRARTEIEEWRALQWERMREWNEQRQTAERERLREQHKELASQQQLIVEEQAKREKRDLEEKAKQEALDQEAKQKAAKAAKRKRAKDRKKAQKAQEALDQEKREKEAALKARREASTQKCDACAGGIVGFAFEKFDHQFCSPKCARAGPSASS